MSALTDPLKIADWLIQRAGNTNGAVDYKNTIEKAKGLLLNPSASGEEAVRVARVMKEQGAIVRKNEGAATPAAAAPAAAAPAPQTPAAQTPAPDAATVAAAAAATAATAAAATEPPAPSEAAPAAAAPEAAPAVEAAPETDENISGSSRRTRHRTPKRKKLSRKKTNKRK